MSPQSLWGYQGTTGPGLPDIPVFQEKLQIPGYMYKISQRLNAGNKSTILKSAKQATQNTDAAWIQPKGHRFGNPSRHFLLSQCAQVAMYKILFFYFCFSKMEWQQYSTTCSFYSASRGSSYIIHVYTYMWRSIPQDGGTCYISP